MPNCDQKSSLEPFCSVELTSSWHSVELPWQTVTEEYWILDKLYKFKRGINSNQKFWQICTSTRYVLNNYSSRKFIEQFRRSCNEQKIKNDRLTDGLKKIVPCATCYVKYKRGPQAVTVTWVSETLHWLHVRRAHIYQQPHHRINAWKSTMV